MHAAAIPVVNRAVLPLVLLLAAAATPGGAAATSHADTSHADTTSQADTPPSHAATPGHADTAGFADTGQGPFSTLVPDEDPDSLGVERVGEIVLFLAPREEEVPWGTDLYLAGDHALMGDFRSRVHFVDISDPADMRKVAEVRTPGPAVDIKISGDLAVIGVQETDIDMDVDFGLLILDISDPANPVEISRLEEPGWRGVHNLFIDRDRLYLAHMDSPGLSIVDISDPATPVVSGSWRRESDLLIHDIFIRDGIAVVSDYFFGLILLDLTDPDAPALLAALPFPEGIHSAWAEGDYVYCNQEFGGWDQRLHVVDIADPRQPRLIHSFGMQPPPHGEILGPHNPWVRDGLLYWACYDAGLRVFDLTDPARPVEAGYHTYPGSAWSAQPHDDGLVYVADGAVGLQAYRITLPQAETAVGHERVDGRPSAFHLAQNYPNPFNQSTVIRIGLDTAADMELTVFNMSGQRVATLARGPHPAGTHSFVWDGRDHRGSEMASGVYAFRLRAGGREQTRKLLLLR